MNITLVKEIEQLNPWLASKSTQIIDKDAFMGLENVENCDVHFVPLEQLHQVLGLIREYIPKA